MSPSPHTRTIGRLHIQVVLGDITQQATDAVVNAANNQLWMGSGVAGAIKDKGGAEIEREALKLGPIEPGQAVTTSAGRLPARYCIHAAVMGQDLVTNAELIAQATKSALSEAARLQLDSVAFPSLGTGVGGFPVDECARVMIAAALEHNRHQPRPSHLTFVLFGPKARDTFVHMLESVPEATA